MINAHAELFYDGFHGFHRFKLRNFGIALDESKKRGYIYLQPYAVAYINAHVGHPATKHSRCLCGEKVESECFWLQNANVGPVPLLIHRVNIVIDEKNRIVIPGKHPINHPKGKRAVCKEHVQHNAKEREPRGVIVFDKNGGVESVHHNFGANAVIRIFDRGDIERFYDADEKAEAYAELDRWQSQLPKDTHYN